MYFKNVVYQEGDIQFSTSDTIVLPVPCDGSMEGEVASIFKRRNPHMYSRYQYFCENNLLTPGKIWIYHTKRRKILLLPTPSTATLHDCLTLGFSKIASAYKEKNVTSIATPLVEYHGATLEAVKKELDHHLSKLDIPVEIFTKHVPRSNTLLPQLEKLCGHLSDREAEEIRRRICFEID